jgi:hypothetical protein
MGRLIKLILGFVCVVVLGIYERFRWIVGSCRVNSLCRWSVATIG